MKNQNADSLAASTAAIPDAASTTGHTWSIRIGSFLTPMAIASGQNAVTVLGMRFLTDSLAISVGLAGLLFTITKIYDGITDPLIGTWSDRTRSRWGRRLPFMFAGGIAMPLGLAVLFGVPDGASMAMAVSLVMLALLIHATAYTLLTIPGLAILVEASTDPHERTTLMSFRVYGNAMGLLIGNTLSAWLLVRFGTDRAGHFQMALVVGAIVLIATMVSVYCLRFAPRTVPAKASQPLAEKLTELTALWSRPIFRQLALSAILFRLLFAQWALAWSNRPFRLLAIAHIFLLFGTSIGTAAMAYFTRYALQAGDDILGTYYLVATIGMVFGMPIWVFLSKRLGKKFCYMAAMMLFSVMHLSWLLAGPGESLWLISPRGLLTGFSGGGMILSAYSMLSDAVRYDFIRSGERREGAFSGFTSLLDKLSGAAAMFAIGAFLASMGYASNSTGEAIQQSPESIVAIRLCVAVLPPLAMLGAILTMTRYDLDPDEVSKAEEELP